MSSGLPNIMNFRDPLDARGKEQKAKVLALEGQLRQANQQSDKRGKDVKKLKEKIREQETEIQQVKEDADSRIEELKQQLETVQTELQSQLKDATAQAAQNLQAKHTAEEKKRNAVRAMKREKELREQAEATLLEERKRIDKLEHHSVRVQKVKKQGEVALREAQIATDTVRNQLTELEAECERLQSELELTRADHASEIEELRENIKSTQDQLADAETRESSLKKEMSSSKQKIEDARAATESAKRVQKAAEDRAAVAATRIGKLEIELEQVKSSLQKTSMELETARQEQQEAAAKAAEAAEVAARPADLIMPEDSESDMLSRIKIALEQRNISLDFLLKGVPSGATTPQTCVSSDRGSHHQPRSTGRSVRSSRPSPSPHNRSKGTLGFSNGVTRSQKPGATNSSDPQVKKRASSKPATTRTSTTATKTATSKVGTRTPRKNQAPSSKIFSAQSQPSTKEATQLHSSQKSTSSQEKVHEMPLNEPTRDDSEPAHIEGNIDDAVHEQQMIPTKPAPGSAAAAAALSRAKQSKEQSVHSQEEITTPEKENSNNTTPQPKSIKKRKEIVNTDNSQKKPSPSPNQLESERSPAVDANGIKNQSITDRPQSASISTKSLRLRPRGKNRIHPEVPPSEDTEGPISGKTSMSEDPQRDGGSSSSASLRRQTSGTIDDPSRRNDRQRKMQQQRREEREQLQKQYQQQKKLQQQQQQERVRRARTKSVEKAQRAVAASIDEVDQPSKLEIGANLFDIVPQTSEESPPQGELQGDFDSLLYPRHDKGWKRTRSHSTASREEIQL